MKPILTCLVSLLMVFTISAQVTLRGTVTNENGEPVPGATVKIDGSTNSTTTDENGNFTLELSDGYETLIISGEGIQTQKIYLTGQNSIAITAKSSSSTDNVVNLGIGSQSKDRLTSSVSSVAAEDVSPAPLINLEQANQGVTAGLFVQNSGGKLGEATNVRVRGGSSLLASNQPLYVIDGVPLTSGNQSNINPSNIESIEILKDAAATAVYGTRAANGVIIITTKGGEEGKMKVNFDYQFGVNQTPKKIDLYSAREYRIQALEFELRNFMTTRDENLFITREILENLEANNATSYSWTTLNQFGEEVPITLNLAAYNQFAFDTDWQDEIFQTGISHRANVDFSGGTENFGYFVSTTYNTQEGILIGNQFDRFNATLSLDGKITSKLKASLNVNFINTSNDELNDNQDLGFPLQAINLPSADGYSAANNFNLNVASAEYNPLTEVNFSDFTTTNTSVIASSSLTYDINDLFQLSVSGGVDLSDFRTEQRQGPQTLEGRPDGLSQLSEQTSENYVFDSWLTYRPDIGVNSLSVTLGASYQKATASFDYRFAEVNGIGILESLQASDSRLVEDPIQGDASVFVSSYSRINYSMGNRFDIAFSGRVDGSSKFSENNRYGFFPSVSGGWNVSNESFYNSSVVQNLRLRSSFGIVGNIPSQDFLYRRNFRTTRYNDREAIVPSNIASDNLKWESTQQFNVGVDFGVLDDRITGSVDYYIKNTEDLLFPKPISQTSGFTEVIDNIGTLTNRGFEVLISSSNIVNNDFSWSTDFNISFNKSEVTDLGGERLEVGVNAFIEGESPGVFFARDYAGVDFSDGRAIYFFIPDPNSSVSEAQQISEAGAYQITDRFGERYVTQDWERATRSVVGDPNPKFFGGITNAVSYKNWELSTLFQFVGGVDLYYATGEFLSNSGISSLGQTADQADRWYAPGDEAPFPKINPLQVNTNPSSRWIQDGAYIRLRTITLTYNFSQEQLSGLGFNHMSIYIGASNLFTITNYTGYDPDVSYFDPLDGLIGQNITRGVDNFSAPQPRIFLSGIKIGF